MNFEVAKKPVDLKVAKFLYDTKQGWSGEASATTRVAGNSFSSGAGQRRRRSAGTLRRHSRKI